MTQRRRKDRARRNSINRRPAHRGRSRLSLETLEPRIVLAGSLQIDTFHDQNENGLHDDGEPQQPGIVIELVDTVDTEAGNGNDKIVAVSSANDNGRVRFEDLADGDYFYRVRHPVGFLLSPQNVGDDDGVDSDPSSETAVSDLINIAGTAVEQDIGLIGAFPKFGTAFRFGSPNSILGNGFVDVGKAIALDDAGNLLVVGSFVGTTDFDVGTGTNVISSSGGSDTFVAKYSPGGALIWVRTFGSTGNDQARGVRVDSSGSVYAVGLVAGDVAPDGETISGKGSTDGFVVKYDSQGAFQWYGTIGGTGADLVNTIALDASADRLVLGGRFRDTVTLPGLSESMTSAGSNDAYVLSLDLDGQFQWAQSAGGGGSADEVIDVTLSTSGQIFALGRFSNSVDFDPGDGEAVRQSAGSADAFLWKLAGDGSYLDVAALSGTDNVFPKAVSVSPDGNVVATGSFRGGVDFDPGEAETRLDSLGQSDIFVAKLSSELELEWARQMGGIASDQANAVAVNALGFIVTSGFFGGIADFDPGSGEYLLDPRNNPGFISYLTPSGDFLSAQSWALIVESALSLDGQLLMTGTFASTAEVVPGFSLQSLGGSDVFVTRVATNQAPIAFPDTVTAIEDETLEIELDGDDGDPTSHQQLAFTITGLPATGKLSTTRDGETIDVSHLPLNLNAPRVYFTTAENDVSQQQFGFRVRDDGGTNNGGVNTSAVATITVDVTPVNDAPSATPQTVAALDRVPLTVELSGEDGDPEVNQALTYTLTSLPSTATLSLSPNEPPIDAGDLPLELPSRELHFLNQATDLTAQTFEFYVRDDGGTENGGIDVSDTAQVTVEVDSNSNPPLNKAPTTDSQSVQVVEDIAETIAFSGDDGDDDRYQTLTFLITSLPEQGTLRESAESDPISSEQLPFALAAAEVLFQTAENEVADQEFTIRVKDSGGTLGGGVDTSDPATVSVSVTAVNDAPVLVSQEFDTYEHITTALVLVGDDGDPEVDQDLLYTVVELPAAGALSLTSLGSPLQQADLPATVSGNTLYFHPQDGNLDSQQFALVLRDDGGTGNNGIDTSGTTQATIHVHAINDAPSVAPQEIEVLEDVTTAIVLTGDDGDEDQDQALEYLVTDLPVSGRVTVAALGEPIAEDELPFALPATSLHFTTAENDVSAQELYVRVKDDGGTEHGGVDLSEAAAIAISVIPVNDAPFLTKTEFATVEDVGFVIELPAEDGDPETDQDLQYFLTRLPSTATLALARNDVAISEADLPLELSAAELYFVPLLDDTSQQSFEIRVLDDGGVEHGGVDQTTATVLVDVARVNDPPEADSIDLVILEDTPTIVALTADDGDPDQDQTLTFVLTTLPATGVLSEGPGAEAIKPTQLPLTLSDPELLIAPADNDVSPQEFRFFVEDDGVGNAVSEVAIVSIEVIPVNDPPLLTSTEFVVNEDTATDLVLRGEDGDPETEQALHFTIVSLPTTARILGDGGTEISAADLPFDLPGDTLRFQPGLNDLSSQEFEVRVADDGGTSNGGLDVSEVTTLTVTIQSINDQPTAADLVYETDEDTPVEVQLSGTDGGDGGQSLEFVLRSLPLEGLLRVTPDAAAISDEQLPFVLPAPSIFFEPARDDTTSQQFEYFVRDDGGTDFGANDASEPAVVTVHIEPHNDPPIILGPDEYSARTYEIIELAGLEVADVDAAEGTVQLQLSVSAGQLFVSTTEEGSEVIVEGDGGESVKISTDLASLQAILSGGRLRYRSPNIFSGEIQISATIDDLGNTGEGGSLSARWDAQIVVDGAYPWHNFGSPLDVNGDGRISPVDALLVIDQINRQGNDSDLPSNASPPPFFDTNQDNWLTAVDALLVINYLNSHPHGEGEGLAREVNVFRAAAAHQQTNESIRAQALQAVLDEARGQKIYELPQRQAIPQRLSRVSTDSRGDAIRGLLDDEDWLIDEGWWEKA